MPIRNLEKLFYPHAIAVVGATSQQRAPGCIAMQNLLHGGFEGPVMPVTTSERAISGVLAYPTIDELPMVPDLAVLCLAADKLPEAIAKLGAQGTRAAILLGDDHIATFRPSRSGDGPLSDAISQARRLGMRVLGPDCLGVIVPGIGLNASVSHTQAHAGAVAFVSQSSAISAAVLDWAHEREIGFSHFVSLGGTMDIDFGDVLDFLGNDPMTRAILLYVESIRAGRTFLSAGRGASRNKPVLVIKSGRTPEGQRAVFGAEPVSSHDPVYDGIFRRAGMLRVDGFSELFAAVETLARTKTVKSGRLALLSNGHGIASMAVDSLILQGGELAALTEATIAGLTPFRVANWPDANPAYLPGDAPAEDYETATRLLLDDANVDALLVLHAPNPGVNSSRAAEAVIAASAKSRKPVLTSWMGGSAVEEARRQFADAAVATHETPNQAVDAFMHLVRFRHNMDMLMETPASTPAGFTPATDAARLLVEEALQRETFKLSDREAKAILSAYGIQTAESRIASTPAEAAAIAAKMGFPVALKVIAEQVRHKAEVGGVDLYLDNPDAVRAAAEHMMITVPKRKRGATITGFTVERMVLRPGAQEVRIKVEDDPIFGPVISFGHGGRAAEMLDDYAVGLPPLNMSLARELINRTRVSKLLGGHGDYPPADLDALCLTLVQVSQLIVDIPEITALEINPVFVDEHGVFAVDTRMRLGVSVRPLEQRLAIRPYPKEEEEGFVLANGRQVLLRPIRPEDEPAHYEFLSKITMDDMRLRFFSTLRTLPHAEMARLTQIDYDREMAFVAVAPAPGGGRETLAVVRTVTDPNNDTAEYAILVRSDLKGQGLGSKLMMKMVRYCQSRGTRRIVGQVLTENKRMLDLVRDLGFTSRLVPGEDIMEVELLLQENAVEGAAA